MLKRGVPPPSRSTDGALVGYSFEVLGTAADSILLVKP